MLLTSSTTKAVSSLRCSPPLDVEHLLQRGGPHPGVNRASDITLGTPPAWARDGAVEGSWGCGGASVEWAEDEVGARRTWGAAWPGVRWVAGSVGWLGAQGRRGFGAHPELGRRGAGSRAPPQEPRGARRRAGASFSPRPSGKVTTPGAGRAGVTAKRSAGRWRRQLAQERAAARVQTRPECPHTPSAADSRPSPGLPAATLPVAVPAVTSSADW